ncbi:putative peptidyl-prolyl cis-trans isomerase [Acaryochloris thomasi RCC1774]|uniref:peptidylprolyl isomerase n=1 Tax=Acaryochloris thomasi RCC1774 TaxID=1764569 RepID=A0A2W1JMS8_9CYAN|nr:putative peptidyl-prolyl cis-trans isomerase [Acaryochloris thomasi RCC1774]
MHMLHQRFRQALTFALGLMLSFSLWATVSPPATAALPPGNAVNDPRALLRLSLPLENEDIRKVQLYLEGTSPQLRGKRWTEISKDLDKASSSLAVRKAGIIDDVPAADRDKAEALIEQIGTGISELKTLAAQQDPQPFKDARAPVLRNVGDLEEMMVQGYPFEVPAEYSNLPQLKGRATVVIDTTKGPMTAIVDGYSAPVTAGNFVDLVKRGFYDGLPFTRTDSSYVIQTGDPEGPEQGFKDRTIPLEVLIEGDSEPIYGFTTEELGLYPAKPALPFSAYGTMAMATSPDDANSASSQFFFLPFEADLTPAGANLLDGRYAVFGYVVEGQEVLGELTKGDKIKSAKVVEGLENLV